MHWIVEEETLTDEGKFHWKAVSWADRLEDADAAAKVLIQMAGHTHFRVVRGTQPEELEASLSS